MLKIYGNINGIPVHKAADVTDQQARAACAVLYVAWYFDDNDFPNKNEISPANISQFTITSGGMPSVPNAPVHVPSAWEHVPTDQIRGQKQDKMGPYPLTINTAKKSPFF